jgi:nucleoside-diphosphate-sugar epimerase
LHNIEQNLEFNKVILVTGASGFIGSAICNKLAAIFPLRASVRDRRLSGLPQNIEIIEAFLTPEHDWSLALKDVSVIIHCASRVHILNELHANPLNEYRNVNVRGTINLALQAAKAGIKRFIYLSSIKVNGEFTIGEDFFSANNLPAPIDPYGISKYEAELALMKLGYKTRMEIVVIRSPLVYGPGVKANFQTMMKWVLSGLPLPFGSITENRRSYIFIDNIVDIIKICILHPAAANQVFLVSDGKDLSTNELLRRIAFALGCQSRLFPLPTTLIMLVAMLIHKSDIAQRLCGSLQVDIKKTRDLLGWVPPVSMDEGFRQTAAHFLKVKC